MSALSELWKKLSKKEYRDAFVGSQIKRLIPLQIRALRKQRDWTQADLAKYANLNQGSISRAEDPDYGNLTINNLLQVAKGFDVALAVRFVPFRELGRWFSDLSEERLGVPSFADDEEPSQEVPEDEPASFNWAGSRSLADMLKNPMPARSVIKGPFANALSVIPARQQLTLADVARPAPIGVLEVYLAPPKKPASQAMNALNPRVDPAMMYEEFYGQRARACR